MENHYFFVENMENQHFWCLFIGKSSINGMFLFPYSSFMLNYQWMHLLLAWVLALLSTMMSSSHWTHINYRCHLILPTVGSLISVDDISIRSRNLPDVEQPFWWIKPSHGERERERAFLSFRLSSICHPSFVIPYLLWKLPSIWKKCFNNPHDMRNSTN